MNTPTRGSYQRLIAAVKALSAAPTAVAHPCDESSLAGPGGPASRADSVQSRLASCAVAALVAHCRRELTVKVG